MRLQTVEVNRPYVERYKPNEPAEFTLTPYWKSAGAEIMRKVD